MALFDRNPNDWQLVTRAELRAHSPEAGPPGERVTVVVRGLPLLFSASRNAAMWIEIAGDDFPIWILVEIDKHLGWAAEKTRFMGKKSFECGDCGATLANAFDVPQTWNFELQAPGHEPFAIEITMPAQICASCRRPNGWERRYSDNIGEALGEIWLDAEKT